MWSVATSPFYDVGVNLLIQCELDSLQQNFPCILWHAEAQAVSGPHLDFLFRVPPGDSDFFLFLSSTQQTVLSRMPIQQPQVVSWSSVFEQIQSWVFVFGGPSSFHLRLLFPSWSCPACAFTQADLLKWDHLQAHAQLMFGVQMCFELLSSSFVWLWRCTKCLTLFTKRASTKICFIKLRHYCFTVLLLFLFGARPDSNAGNCSIPILQWLCSFCWS